MRARPPCCNNRARGAGDTPCLRRPRAGTSPRARVHLPRLFLARPVREHPLPGQRLRARLLAGRPRDAGPARRPDRGRTGPLHELRDRRLQLAHHAGAAALRLLCADPHPARRRRHARPWPRSPHAEAAKRRLVYQLDDLGLPVDRPDGARRGLAFDLLSQREQKVITGHADGVITIDLAEGDDAHREAAARPAGRAVPHAARALPARDRPLLLGGAGRPATARRASSASCSATSAPTTPRRCSGTTPRARRRTGASLRQRLRHHAPVGGLGRDLRPLPAHPRHPADRGGLRAGRRRPGRRDARPRGAAGGGAPASSRTIRRDRRDLAAADLRAQRREPQHGRGRPLPVRAGADGAGEAARSCTTW